jgi:Staphylococcus phage HNH endonuclease
MDERPARYKGRTRLDGSWPVHHAMSGHPLLQTWYNMLARCQNPEHDGYHNYGGRGIQVHPDWRDDPRPFIEWLLANLGPRPDGMTLDRINNDGNYEPGNLRWATHAQQAANRRTTRKGTSA